MALASYFEQGKTVEAKFDGEWRLANLESIDQGDDILPYGVRFTDGGRFEWVAATDVREIAAPTASVLQVRWRNGSRWSDWSRLTLGATVAVNSYNSNAFQVRQAPTRTDAEILAELRKNDAHMTQQLREILGGNF